MLEKDTVGSFLSYALNLLFETFLTFVLIIKLKRTKCVGEIKNPCRAFAHKTWRHLSALIYLKIHLCLIQMAVNMAILFLVFPVFNSFSSAPISVTNVEKNNACFDKRIDYSLPDCKLLDSSGPWSKIQCCVKTSNMLLINVMSLRASIYIVPEFPLFSWSCLQYFRTL